MAPVSCCYHVATDPADVSRGLFSQRALALDLERSNRGAVLPGVKLRIRDSVVHQHRAGVRSVVVAVMDGLAEDDPRGYLIGIAQHDHRLVIRAGVEIRKPVRT